MTMNLTDPAQIFSAKTQEYSRMFGAQPLVQSPLGFGGFGSTGSGSLATLLKGLSQALQGLSELIGGLGGGNTGRLVMPEPMTLLPTGSTGSTGDVAGMKPIAGTARIWGDPHFIGADGGQFDVQGKAGKTYNLLSDRGFQMNGRFDSWGGKGATVVGEVGITAGTNYVNVEKSGKAVVNGHVLKDGERVALRGGGYAEKKGNEITVKSGEWEVNFQTHRDHINMDIKTSNAVADGVRPHGLIGQTFDGDGKARNGDKGAGVQGGGAIEDINGDIVRRGDKSAVKSYEVAALWDTNFQNHNADHGHSSVLLNATSNALATLAMTGFSTLFASLFSTSGNYGWGGSHW